MGVCICNGHRRYMITGHKVIEYYREGNLLEQSWQSILSKLHTPSLLLLCRESPRNPTPLCGGTMRYRICSQSIDSRSLAFAATRARLGYYHHSISLNSPSGRNDIPHEGFGTDDPNTLFTYAKNVPGPLQICFTGHQEH